MNTAASGSSLPETNQLDFTGTWLTRGGSRVNVRRLEEPDPFYPTAVFIHVCKVEARPALWDMNGNLVRPVNRNGDLMERISESVRVAAHA